MTTQEQKALELALDFVEDVYLGEWRGPTERQEEVITAIKKALSSPNGEAQQPQERNALPKAMNVVIAAMQADPGYAWSWHCNIAMAYVDEGVNRDVANQGAARFMKLLANVEPAHDILPTQTPDTKLNEQEPVGRIASNVKPVMRQEVMLYTDKPLPIGTALYVKEKL